MEIIKWSLKRNSKVLWKGMTILRDKYFARENKVCNTGFGNTV